MRASRECYSKPARWVVQRRIRERQLGYRAVQVLAFIKARLEAGQPPPSYREICDVFGMDRGNLHRLVVSLEKRGKIERADQSPDRQQPIIRSLA